MIDETQIQKIEDPEIESGVVDFMTVAESLPVETVADYEKAAEHYKAGKALVKTIVGYFKDSKEKAHAAWQAICKLEREAKARVEPGLKLLDGRMADWDRAEQARIRAEQEKARQEAEAKALEEAAALESANLKEAAEERLLQQEQAPPLPPPSRPAPQVAGVHKRKTWDFEIIDKTKLDMLYLIPDEVRIRKIVKAHGEDAQKVLGEGVRVFEKHGRMVR